MYPIAKVESWHTDKVGFVRVTDTDGREGWGQLSPYETGISVLMLHRHLAARAFAADPDDIEAFVASCFRGGFIFKVYGNMLCRALCGIETALWDLKARKANVPVCALLGGEPRPIPVYASSLSRMQPQDEVERFKRLQDAHGYRAFKFKVMLPSGNDADVYPGRSKEVVEAMAKAFPPPEHTLIADANGGFSEDRAYAFSEHLEACGVAYFEEPVFMWDVDAVARFGPRSRVPVMSGENIFDMLYWRHQIERKSVAVVEPDVGYMGGIVRTRQLVREARAQGLAYSIHCSNPSWLVMFSAHLMTAEPTTMPFLEFGIEDNPWIDGAYTPFAEIRDGHYHMSDAPGWGVVVNEDWLAGAEYTVTRV